MGKGLLLWIASLFWLLPAQLSERPFDVLEYNAAVRPDIANKSVSGEVTIRLRFLSGGVKTIEFDRGELVIDEVRFRNRRVTFEELPRRVRVSLPEEPARESTEDVSIIYHGTPRSGLQFVPERQQAYTIFTTSQWLVCVDAPEDKAALDLRVTLPAGLQAAGPGTLVSQQAGPAGTVTYRWRETRPYSTYLFGFAAGRFTHAEVRHGKTLLRYLGEGFSPDELTRAFSETPRMLDFFADRAGMAFPADVYTQVMVANTAGQEASGFALFSDAHGRAFLNEPENVSLIAHELAHQWWGNLVTCRDWTHFWLNEGFATFMAAAYNEHRFGPEAYRRDIERTRILYEEVRLKGGDRSLAFPDWNRPSAADRTLVYRKGAYVLHLLRQRMGNDAFWAGIRRYTTAHAGRSVTTDDFKRSMEQSSGLNLGEFFDEWIYLRR